MKNRKLSVIGMAAGLMVLALSLMAFAVPGEMDFNPAQPVGSPGNGGAQLYPGTSLSDLEKEALTKAILEEYGAYNLYQSVIDRFGLVAPFTMIAKSEQQHINALTRLADRYGVTVPANPGLVETPVFSSLSDACQAGVAAEIADAELYDELRPDVTHADIQRVFDNLQSASLNSHLPAFQTCQ